MLGNNDLLGWTAAQLALTERLHCSFNAESAKQKIIADQLEPEKSWTLLRDGPLPVLPGDFKLTNKQINVIPTSNCSTSDFSMSPTTSS